MHSLSHPQSSMLSFVEKERAFTKTVRKRNPTAQPTHILQDGHRGGSLVIEPSKEEELNRFFATDISKKRALFVLEVLTKIFAFFYDYDVKRHRLYRCSGDDLKQDILDMHMTTMGFYDPETKVREPGRFQALVFRTADADCGGEKVKMACRVIYGWKGGLLVDRRRAALIALTAQGRMAFKHGTPEPEQQNDWKDAIDVKPYGKRGGAPGNIRRIGSCKSDKCPECGGSEDERDGCATCHGIGKVNLGRVYQPWFVLNADGTENQQTLEFLQQNVYTMVEASTVRRPCGAVLTPGWNPPADAPNVPELTEEEEAKEASLRKRLDRVLETTDDPKKRNLARLKKAILQDLENGEDRQSLMSQSRGLERLPLDVTTSVMVDNMHQYIRKIPRYGRVSIRAIYRKVSGRTGGFDWYRAYVIGDGSSFCANLRGPGGEIGAKHHNATVYFEFKPDGLRVRCNCTCETTANRRTGVCSRYASQAYQFSKKMKILLFSATGKNAGSLAMLKEQPRATRENRSVLAKHLEHLLIRLSLDLSAGVGVRPRKKAAKGAHADKRREDSDEYDDYEDGGEGSRTKTKKNNSKQVNRGKKSRSSSSSSSPLSAASAAAPSRKRKFVVDRDDRDEMDRPQKRPRKSSRPAEANRKRKFVDQDPIEFDEHDSPSDQEKRAPKRRRKAID